MKLANALFNALLLVLAALALPLASVWLIASPRARAGLRERLAPLDAVPGAGARAFVWLHGASVGEAEAAVPLISRLLERGLPVRATALTLTGCARLRSRFPGLPVRLAPLDLPWLARASFERASARVLVLVETELWPNLLFAAHAAGVRVVIASARISDRSLRRYRLLRPWLAPLLARVAAIGARSEQDRARFVELGALPERTSVTGDLKLDRPAAEPPGTELRAALGPGPFLVGGSTHPGEEEALLQSWRFLREGPAPRLRLILAPRHPERTDEVASSARRMGASCGLRSRGAAQSDVVVVDTLGELGTIYHLADLVFCGGTLAPVGGHNLVEPVQAGRVVVHGKHIENQRAQASILQPLGVLHEVADARELSEVLAQLWADPDRNAPARAASHALLAHRGAAGLALALVLAAWGDGA